MISKSELLSCLPPFANQEVLLTLDQGTGEIMSEIIATHKATTEHYDAIHPFFDCYDPLDTAIYIWNFLKYNLKYKVEPAEIQTVKTPAAILQDNATVDCKHYALFAAGILDAINRNNCEAIDWCYRFAGYKGKQIEHVFIVLYPNTEFETWLDPVLNSFDDHSEMPKYFKDKYIEPTIAVSGIGALYRISGVNKPQERSFTVDENEAAEAFLIAVERNYYGLRQFFKKYWTIVEPWLWQCLNKEQAEHFNRIING
jgi:hypothetical protein